MLRLRRKYLPLLIYIDSVLRLEDGNRKDLGMRKNARGKCEHGRYLYRPTFTFISMILIDGTALISSETAIDHLSPGALSSRKMKNRIPQCQLFQSFPDYFFFLSVFRLFIKANYGRGCRRGWVVSARTLTLIKCFPIGKGMSLNADG